MNRKPLQLALREMQAAALSRPTQVGMVLAVILLTIGGPFGTFQNFGLGQRLLYWLAIVVVCFLLGQGAATFFIELLRERITQRWPRLIVASLLAAIPVTVAAIAINAVGYRHFNLDEAMTMWLYVTIVTLVVVVSLVLLSDALATRNVPAPARADTGPSVGAAAGTPPILERVPLPQRGKLLALIVEDHYVDIVTDKGKALVLMRLADAMREASDVPGLQIHRSHWVAADAVVRAVRGDGKLSLELSNGLRLPVSRGFLPAVRSAGLG